MCHVFQKWRTECCVYGFRENGFSSGFETFLGDTKFKSWRGIIRHLFLVTRVVRILELGSNFMIYPLVFAKVTPCSKCYRIQGSLKGPGRAKMSRAPRDEVGPPDR